MRPRCFPLALFACLLCLGQSYTLRSSVSWVVSSNDVDVDDADLSEEVAPALLVDGAGLWKANVLGDSIEAPREQAKAEGDAAAARQSSRLFSYRIEKVKKAGSSAPPPHQETARTARYIAHYSDWGHLATISTLDKIKGLPFGNIFSVSDGPLDNSTGVIYFYVTPMDNTVADLKSNPYASLTFSEAEGEFCRQMMYDPEDPRCARLTLTGKMVEVLPEELAFAKEAMFSRHPVMAKWPVGHKWFFMKMDLVQVWLQDWIGGVSLVPVEDYFKATPF
ncbi:Protein CREG2 [Oryzias melastigma]|uniref:Cellular repressor of E1A-stimulated genes 2 n=1 Tax=Oryzias melastigma TaxID=30732 RepID=A0A3B3BXY3_ORYME|nr:protein CREG2 [Oryzias melastigma]KAF6717013.1 Protein CREG2 [Oryzias melastigma]